MRHTLIVRPYSLEDMDQLSEIQRECFPLPYPEEQLWTRDQIASHIRIFPEGALCVETPEGNPRNHTLYGVDIAVRPSRKERKWQCDPAQGPPQRRLQAVYSPNHPLLEGGSYEENNSSHLFVN